MDELQSDARTIDSVFKRYGIGARVSRKPYTCFQSAAWSVYALQRTETTKARDVVKLADEIDEALTDIKMKATRCRFETLPLRILTPRHKPNPQSTIDVLRKYAEEARRRAGLHVALGEVVSVNKAQTLIADMTQSTMPHMLIAGTTGSGKTYQMMNIVMSLSALNEPSNLEIVVIDPKAIDMHILDGLPGMRHAVVQELGDCVDALNDAVAEIDRRKAQRMRDPERRYVVVVDEIADLIAVGGKSVVTAIERIVQVGRGVGVHFIGGTQKPTNDIFESQVIKSNMPLRICGMVQSKNDANVATGTTDSGAERLSTAGSFVMVTAGGRMEMIQAYHLDENQVRRLGGGSIARQYRRTNNASTSVATPILPADTGIDTAVDTTRRLAFDVHNGPTLEEARIIRVLLKSGMSKNRIIAEILPNANRNKCFDFINAATQRQGVTQ